MKEDDIMLTPELQKLKERLEGKRPHIDTDSLLQELYELDSTEMRALYESLAVASECCPACGRPY